MIDMPTENMRRGSPSHGRGHWFNPSIAHHSGNQVNRLIFLALRRSVPRRESPLYSARFSEQQRNTERALGQNPGAMFRACSCAYRNGGEG